MPIEPSLPAQPTESLDDSADSFLREAAAVSDPSMGEAVRPSLTAGDVLADRFVIERLAGRGGMGAVYRALDRMTGTLVALKVMARAGQDNERFAQEARVLSELSHPTIVRYVVHGTTSRGEPFLAMEWLEGEDLSDRLARTGLTVEESVSVAIRVAEGLAAAHARGVVHRDVKPSNVLLPGGDPRAAKLLDFGVARLGQRPMTRTGRAIGTAGYMAPEQAVGAKDVDARADVFALGCLLYECLTGVPAFAGEHPVAVLAKLLHQHPAGVRERRPEIPEALSRLVERMLAKDRADRPQGGADVSAALRAIGSLRGSAPAVPGISPSATGGERRVLSVLLIEPRGPTEHLTPDEGARQAMEAVADAAVKPFDAEVAILQGGALVVTVAGTGAAHDNAARAARCALVLHESLPDAIVALATGRAETTGGLPVGVAIDRAASLLATHPSADGVLLDETTAALLDSSFEVVTTGGIALLQGRSADRDGVRRLLGKPTACVGREKELGLLEATLAECVDESVARVVLVTAVPGVGKSRLRQEFVARVRDRPDVRVLTARADMVRAGSSLDLARQLFRAAAEVPEGLAPDDAWRRVSSYVGALTIPDARRVAEFLGELAGAPSTDEPSLPLRTARNDGPTMHGQMRRAFGEWFAAESAKGPLLVVLEDLHWGDAASLEYLTEALRLLAEEPLMILVLARPEVHEAFPRLRSLPGLLELALGGLTRRAAERLVVAVLGDSPSPATIQAIVERAAGNAFYLEELVRSAAEGRAGDLPDTVLAMVESRLARLEPEAREVLRAASVFGARFWVEGVQTLVPNAAEWMDSLAAREMIEASRSTRFPGATEYAFRHALVRDAAYAMLTAQGREAAHRAAAAWLERIGESDPLAIVVHHEMAGDRLSAATWLVKAATDARKAGASDRLMALCDRGLVEGIPHDLYVEFLDLRSTGLTYLARWTEAAVGGQELMRLCEPGTLGWFSGAATCLTAAQNGDTRGVADVAIGLSSMREAPVATRDWGLAAMLLIGLFAELGQSEMVRLVKGLLDATRVAPDADPAFLGYKNAADALFCHLSGDPAGGLASAKAALQCLEDAGDGIGLLAMRCFCLPVVFREAGQYSSARQIAEAAASEALDRDLRSLHDLAVRQATLAASAQCDRTGALGQLARLCDKSNANLQSYVPQMKLGAELAHSPVDLDALAAAQAEARQVLEGGLVFPRAAIWNRTFLALAAVACGRWSEALSLADQTFSDAAALGTPTTEVMLARAEALQGLGRFDEARTAIETARSRLLAQAQGFADASDRATFLAGSHIARTLELAREWLRDGPATS
jgi:eukaryotic-like serine/threonine-protein kinase